MATKYSFVSQGGTYQVLYTDQSLKSSILIGFSFKANALESSPLGELLSFFKRRVILKISVVFWN